MMLRTCSCNGCDPGSLPCDARDARACNALRCTSCDLPVLRLEGCAWTTGVDYLFCRNNYPDLAWLRARTTERTGEQAESCTVAGYMLLSKTSHTSCNLLLSPVSAIYCTLCLIPLLCDTPLQSPFALILGLQLCSSHHSMQSGGVPRVSTLCQSQRLTPWHRCIHTCAHSFSVVHHPHLRGT